MDTRCLTRPLLINLMFQEPHFFRTFSPMDTPPDVMMTSARLIPSFKALSKSSGLEKKKDKLTHKEKFLYIVPAEN